ncbi:alpha/beta hydrolase [Thalassolituus sp. LLYu03]|uniref:alpha/beta hydrolase n=1 Tax=Thalassolituus sp. LLYu03 TaxID=3421656 RepID=UPI003D2859F7
MQAQTKPPIVFIHGMWCGPEVFEPYERFFCERGYECHRPALRHHEPLNNGLPALGRTSLKDYADDLEVFIRTLPQKPVLIGHSMGGLLVQMLCARDLVAKAVLLCPASPAGIHALSPSVVRSFMGVMARWGFWKKPNKLSPTAARYALFNKLSPQAAQDAYLQMRYESGRAAFEIGFWLIDPNKTTVVNPASVQQPMLVVSGDDDHITPATINKKVAARYRHAQYRSYPNHAHWLIAEPGWEKIANDVALWLENEPYATAKAVAETESVD